VATSHAEKVMLGEAGEALVLSRLLRHGHVASLAPRTWKADDILIHGGPSIQVKTSDKGRRPEWLLAREIDVRSSRFFALADYRDPIAPVVYVLPSEDLERAADTADRCYYEQRPLSKPFSGRTISDGWNHDVLEFPSGWLQPYREAWNLIPGPAPDPPTSVLDGGEGIHS